MRFSKLHARRYLIAGVLVITPLWVTWLVLNFIFTLLSGMGRPWVNGFTGLIGQASPRAGEILSSSHLESVLAALPTLFILYVIGWTTSRVLVRQVSHSDLRRSARYGASIFVR